MNMQLMLGVAVACYFLSLFFLCFYREKLNIKFFNGLFIVVDMILYFLWNLAYAENGWLKDGFMTLENISPFVFTIIPLTVFMNKKTKEYAYSAIAFLHLGLFLATLISPEYEVIFGNRTEATFAFAAEAMCHVLAALFGLYLLLTKQVKADFEHWGKAIIFLLGWISFGIFLNITLDTRCFGLNPNNYSIYMLDIFGTFKATVMAYYFGVILVLTIGMQSGYGLCKMVDKIKAQYHAHKNVKEHFDEINKAEILTLKTRNYNSEDASVTPATDREQNSQEQISSS